MSTKLQNIACMPAITWHKLKINDSNVELPSAIKLDGVPPVAVSGLDGEHLASARADVDAATGVNGEHHGASGGADDAPQNFADILKDEKSDFANAMNKAQECWYGHHKDDEVAISSALANDEEAEYGGLSMSEYQKCADKIELAKDIRAAFETGLGQKAYEWMRTLADEPIVVKSEEGAKVEENITVSGQDCAAKISAIDVVAAKDSTLTLNILVNGADGAASGAGAGSNDGAGSAGSKDGAGAATTDGASSNDGAASAGSVAKNFSALTGTSLRIFAGRGSHVIIRRVQTLTDNYIDLDDMGLFASKDSHVEIHQTLLGAGKTVTGVAGDLRGKSSQAQINLHYLGRNNQQRDFNYTLSHHGQKSTCQIIANGVLAGCSQKTLRGTIDLIKGAKGAQGSENENVLLIDDGVRNKTVPIILCNEDDVAGNHGATIGHIRADQMFYLASRGLSQKQAEEMFMSAYLENALIDAANDDIRSAIIELGNNTIKNFEETCA